MKPTEEQKIKNDQLLLIEEIDRAITLLVSTSETYCKDNQTKAIPMIILKEFHKVLITNYKKAALK